MSDPDTPHSTKPRANPVNVGHSSHEENAPAYTTPDSTSRWRRSTVSAQAPDGTSTRNDVADQMMNRVEICASDIPWSANSSA